MAKKKSQAFAEVGPEQPGSSQPQFMKRGPTALAKNRGTGLETFFADPPLTPAEHSEERNEIYYPDRPFVDRIQECIQRFRARRRLTPDLTKYFNAYLFLGGVDTQPRQFTGLDMAELREMTPAERREVQATDTVHTAGSTGERFYNHNDPDHWDVDFTSVAAGFFSEIVPSLAGGRENAAISVVEHFLRYVLQHDVCLEYEQDVQRALALCNTAREELPRIQDCLTQFPGQLNMAAMQLYCHGTEDSGVVNSVHGFRPPDGFNASLFFETAVLLAGDESQAKALQEASEVRIVKEVQRDLELIEVVRPSDELVHIFRGMRLNPPDGPKGVMEPIGRALLRPCIIEDGWYRPDQLHPSCLPNVSLLLDDAILQLLRPGMKFRLDLCELSIGLTFVKNVQGVFPSFHVFLPQHLMNHYKEPLENPRLAPSVLNPDAEENELSVAV